MKYKIISHNDQDILQELVEAPVNTWAVEAEKEKWLNDELGSEFVIDYSRSKTVYYVPYTRKTCLNTINKSLLGHDKISKIYLEGSAAYTPWNFGNTTVSDLDFKVITNFSGFHECTDSINAIFTTIFGRELPFNKLNSFRINGVVVSVYLRIAWTESVSRFKFCDYNFSFNDTTRAHISDSHGAVPINISNGKFRYELRPSIFKSRELYDWFRNKNLCLVSTPQKLIRFSCSVSCLLSKLELSLVQPDIPFLISRNIHTMWKTNKSSFKSHLNNITQHFLDLHRSGPAQKKLFAALFFMVKCVQAYPLSEDSNAILNCFSETFSDLVKRLYSVNPSPFDVSNGSKTIDIDAAIAIYKEKHEHDNSCRFLYENPTANCIETLLNLAKSELSFPNDAAKEILFSLMMHLRIQTISKQDLLVESSALYKFELPNVNSTEDFFAVLLRTLAKNKGSHTQFSEVLQAILKKSESGIKIDLHFLFKKPALKRVKKTHFINVLTMLIEKRSEYPPKVVLDCFHILIKHRNFLFGGVTGAARATALNLMVPFLTNFEGLKDAPGFRIVSTLMLSYPSLFTWKNMSKFKSFVALNKDLFDHNFLDDLLQHLPNSDNTLSPTYFKFIQGLFVETVEGTQTSKNYLSTLSLLEKFEARRKKKKKGKSERSFIQYKYVKLLKTPPMAIQKGFFEDLKNVKAKCLISYAQKITSLRKPKSIFDCPLFQYFQKTYEETGSHDPRALFQLHLNSFMETLLLSDPKKLPKNFHQDLKLYLKLNRQAGKYPAFLMNIASLSKKFGDRNSEKLLLIEMCQVQDICSKQTGKIYTTAQEKNQYWRSLGESMSYIFDHLDPILNDKKNIGVAVEGLKNLMVLTCKEFPAQLGPTIEPDDLDKLSRLFDLYKSDEPLYLKLEPMLVEIFASLSTIKNLKVNLRDNLYPPIKKIGIPQHIVQNYKSSKTPKKREIYKHLENIFKNLRLSVGTSIDGKVSNLGYFF